MFRNVRVSGGGVNNIPFKAVLFDLDGTLLNTLDDIADSMNSILIKSGYPAHPVDSYKKFVGDGMENLIKRVLPGAFHKPEIIEDLVGQMKEEYSKRQDIKTRPYPGIRELLENLTRQNIRLSILSNKPDEMTKSVVSHYFPEKPFDIVMGQKDGSPQKPDPFGALEIADFLQINPKEFLYLGDTDTDMKTAASAGMYPVGVLWGFRSYEELKANGAKLLIKTPMELMKFIKN